ncbi:late embryogenesis abundant protein 1-like [Phoenix dactylifera]|uniref:Late embryogenesis abundant protein 1-like n=1 Tax=Phoenix dactylifera TaxID=42345 RepID=A0A8B7CV99_PHODC|nr:late embryogenesis abundant protein 1-like [Phoenix dactylifera]
MADKSDMRYKAGQATGHAQVKKDEMADSAHNAAQQAGGYVQHAGDQMKNMAQGAADAVKNAVGMEGSTTTTTTKR